MSKCSGKSARKGEECEEIASWIVSYGDLMTLLLTFFILIVSFSTMELIKFRKFMGAMRGASGVLMEQEGNSVVPRNLSKNAQQALRQDVLMENVNKVLADLSDEAEKHKGNGNGITIEKSKEGIRIRISSPILFNSGQAVLKRSAYRLFDLIALIIKRSNCSVIIEGHTDNVPIHTAQFPSNWELSTTRALSVLKYFVNVHDVDPHKLVAIGRGQYKPIAPNDTPENRSRNRRVEIYLNWEDKTGKELLEERNNKKQSTVARSSDK